MLNSWNIFQAVSNKYHQMPIPKLYVSFSPVINLVLCILESGLECIEALNCFDKFLHSS